MYKGDPSGEVTDQYLDAGRLMITFFKLGIEMADMDPIRAEGLSTQLNILFKNYGINLDNPI